MPRIPVFYSFHFDNDVMRVQQVRNIGMIDDNEPVTKNEWEAVRRGGDAAIKRWIDENMSHRRCVVVLIGSETANRRWVRHEILKAWNDHRGLVGVYIHNLRCPRNGTSTKGRDPFSLIEMENGGTMADYITCHDPGINAYRTIAANLQWWVENAVEEARARWR